MNASSNPTESSDLLIDVADSGLSPNVAKLIQSLGPRHLSKVEEFKRLHKENEVLTIVFTDIVGSTQLKKDIGDVRALELTEEHHAFVRKLMAGHQDGVIIETAGDSFLLVFSSPSSAVRFALQLQAGNRNMSAQLKGPMLDRVGIHTGEIHVIERGVGFDRKSVFGLQVDTCARIQSVAEGGQILMSKFVFDNSRQILKGQEMTGIGSLGWNNYGPYGFKGADEHDVCEVGELGHAVLKAPGRSEKGWPKLPEDEVLAWRPSVDVVVPGTQFKLEAKLGEGGFGEIWRAVHKATKEKRVFKFCFRTDRVRSLKREKTLFDVLKEKVELPQHIVEVLDVYLDEPSNKPPYYLAMEYVEGEDLRKWWKRREEEGREPTEIERLEVVTQVAEALAAAHGVGVLHRDVKPSNILVKEEAGKLMVKLTDFGIGQVMSEEVLAKVGRLGFSATMMGEENNSGTLMYMAPELLSNKVAERRASPRSDLYSLGVVLYQLLVGDLEHAVGIEWEKRVKDPVLREDLRMCLAEDIEKRYTGPWELEKQLKVLAERRQEYLEQQNQQNSRKLWQTRFVAVAIGILAIVAVAVGTFALKEKQRAENQTKKAQAAELDAKHNTAKSDFLLACQRVEQDKSDVALAYLSKAIMLDSSNTAVQVRLFTLLTQKPWPHLISVLPHNDAVRSASFSPYGRCVVTASSDYTAQVWDTTTSKPVGEPMQHKNYVNSAKFSLDGRWVVTASWDYTARVWDAVTGRPVSEPMRHGAWVHSAEFSSNGKWVVTASEDKTARVWDAATGKPVSDPIRHDREVHYAEFSPDGRWVVTASDDYIAQVWDTTTSKPVGEPMRHDSWVKSAAFSPDVGMRVLTVSGAAVRVWNATTGKPLSEPMQHDGDVQSAKFSPNGRWVVTASDDHTARVWDAATGKPVSDPMRHYRNVLCAEFSSDGRWVVTSSKDKTARVWDATTGKPMSESMQHDGDVLSAQFSPDGRRVVTASEDNTARVWDVSIDKTMRMPMQHDAQVYDAEFSPDGRWVVTASRKAARVWDVDTGNPVSEFMKHDEMVHFAKFSPDGRWVVTASYDKTARVWNAATGKPVSDPIQHDGDVRSAKFSPDGRWVVTASVDYSARVWDAATGRPVGAPMRHHSSVRSAEFSPNGRWIVTASQDKTTRVWNATTGKSLSEPMRHDDVVWSAKFSPDGRWVATASNDKTARVWDAATGRQVSEPIQHDDVVWSAKFSPDGRWVVTASVDSTARVWDAATGKPVSEPMRHDSSVNFAEFSPDGRWVVTASSDHTARMWPLAVYTHRLAETDATVITRIAAFCGGFLLDSQSDLLRPMPVSERVKLEHQLETSRNHPLYGNLIRYLIDPPESKPLSPLPDCRRSVSITP